MTERRHLESCHECGRTTRHGKPYCPDHIEMMPAVLRIHARLAERAEEAAGGRIDSAGPLVEDALAELTCGPKSVRNLARHLDIELEVAERVATRLVRKGWVSATMHLRGGRMLELKTYGQEPTPR